MASSKRAGPSTARTPSGDAASSSHGGPKRTEKPRKRTSHAPGGGGDAPLPGVQKLKAALRQTRRLLAKENLAADTRVVAERKLKAQEAELVAAETARTEKAMAVRYHKVKFFERQKVTRKLAQTHKALESEELSKDEKKELKKTLKALRVDLHYIINYPKTRKYISLFPPSLRGAAEEASVDEVEQAKTDAEREALRKEIRAKMKAGELSEEPEKELDEKRDSGGGGGGIVQNPDDEDDEDVDMNDDEPNARSVVRKEKPKKKASKSKPTSVSTAAPPALGEDDFFAPDDEDD